MEITLLTPRSGYLSEIDSVIKEYINDLLNNYSIEEKKAIFLKKDMFNNICYIYKDNNLISTIRSPIFNLKQDFKGGELYYEIIIKIDEVAKQ